MKKSLFLSAFTLMFLFSSNAFADSAYTTGDYFRDIGIKFSRGLGNIVSSPAEIPCTMVSDTKEKQALGLATGLGKGLGLMAYRLWVGVDEAITFVIPMEATLPPVCHDSKKA